MLTALDASFHTLPVEQRFSKTGQNVPLGAGYSILELNGSHPHHPYMERSMTKPHYTREQEERMGVIWQPPKSK